MCTCNVVCVYVYTQETCVFACVDSVHVYAQETCGGFEGHLTVKTDVIKQPALLVLFPFL